MMRCPKCENKALIIDTRYRKVAKEMYRRQECPCCGFRFSTKEHYAKDYSKPIARIKGMKDDKVVDYYSSV